MKWGIPNTLFGAMSGFLVGITGSLGLDFVGLHLGGPGMVAGGVLGALFGGWVGWQGGALALWCGGTTAVVGALSFAAGFIGPMVLMPNANQGPLLGIFVTGPLGLLAGAVLGTVIGLVVRARRGEGSGRPVLLQHA